ncbi:MAG: hypothetical protein HC767_15205 [Akkermansiaceae bacterium]|nr:hypothetical protein [Akkermansiaceae bacterium]
MSGEHPALSAASLAAPIGHMMRRPSTFFVALETSCISARLLQLGKMLLASASVSTFLVVAAAAQAGALFSQQATAPFDCGQVRVDSPNTTYSGFLAAELTVRSGFLK